MFIEVIAESVCDVRAIGDWASRIELVSSLEQAGLSPSRDLLCQVLKESLLPIRVMVRPHSKGFVYSDSEFGVMLGEVHDLVKLRDAVGPRLEGIVIGMLDLSGRIDSSQLQAVVDVVKGSPLKITFHKAIDCAAEYEDAVKEVVNFYPQVDTILTQGGSSPLADNLGRLQELKKAWEGTMLVGGGVNFGNCQGLVQRGLACLHTGSAVRKGGQVDPALVEQFASKCRASLKK